MNIPALTSIARLACRPALCVPQYTVRSFDQLPVPLSKAFPLVNGKSADIRAVVLDKDNCFAAPGANDVHASNLETFRGLLKEYTAANILIVSNSSGLSFKDPDGSKAQTLERSTGVRVLRHESRKPACQQEILDHFKGTINSPSQIAIIGDRLMTDIIMANMMGAYGIWIREGVIADKGPLTRLEYGLEAFLRWRDVQAPVIS